MHGSARLARHSQVAISQLERMHADPVRLMHRARRFGFIHVPAPQGAGIHHFSLVVEYIRKNFCLCLELFHRGGTMRDIQVSTRLRVAIDVAGTNQILERFKPVTDLRMHLQGCIHTPALDPL